jgi:hypothetical protein
LDLALEGVATIGVEIRDPAFQGRCPQAGFYSQPSSARSGVQICHVDDLVAFKLHDVIISARASSVGGRTPAPVCVA